MNIQRFNWSNSLRPFLLSFALLLTVSPLNAFSIGWSAVIQSVCYVMLTYILLSKCKDEDFLITASAIVLGRIFLELPVRMLDFNSSRTTLMMSLFPLWNILMTAWYYKCKKKWVSILWVTGCIFFIFWGHGWWIEWCTGKNTTVYHLYIKELTGRSIPYWE